MTDASLAALAGLTNLEAINLSGTNMTGSGLVHLAGLSHLRILSIPNSPLDDAGLANVGRLTGLTALYIGGGAYTDAGVASLSRLTGLMKLGIGSAGCTDACLAHLSGLTRLETLQDRRRAGHGRMAGPPGHDEVSPRGDDRRPLGEPGGHRPAASVAACGSDLREWPAQVTKAPETVLRVPLLWSRPRIRSITPAGHDGLRPGPEIPRHAGYSLR